jgi:DNA-binding NtrC family response regulator
VTERPKSSHQPASAGEPIVFVIDDDASMRRALTNLFNRWAWGLRYSAATARHPERVLLGHPFNPRHLVPLGAYNPDGSTTPLAASCQQNQMSSYAQNGISSLFKFALVVL